MTEHDETTYPMGAVTRITGLSADVLRAWERRYRVVEPLRTEGGTRRYRASDLERLRLVKASVDAGHRISEVARLSADDLEKLAAPAERDRSGVVIEETLEALRQLDSGRAEQLIGGQLAALGPVRCAREFGVPLVEAIGEGWEKRRLCVASEHMGSALLRSLLGATLRPTLAHRHAPLVVFATPAGERHELGLLIAALTAMGAGANPLYLGPDLPVEEIVHAADLTHAPVVALSVVVLDADRASEQLRGLRDALGDRTEVWIGGARAAELELPDGVRGIGSLDQLERAVELLTARTR